MKLNFWQWLGIVLLVLGAIGYMIYTKERQPAAPTGTGPTAPTEIPRAPASTSAPVTSP